MKTLHKGLSNIALFYAAAACTLIAGILHLAIVPMFYAQMTIDVGHKFRIEDV